jgi:hypothetical protein
MVPELDIVYLKSRQWSCAGLLCLASLLPAFLMPRPTVVLDDPDPDFGFPFRIPAVTSMNGWCYLAVPMVDQCHDPVIAASVDRDDVSF